MAIHHHPLYEAYTTQWSDLLRRMSPQDRLASLNGQRELLAEVLHPNLHVIHDIRQWIDAQEQAIIGPDGEGEKCA